MSNVIIFGNTQLAELAAYYLRTDSIHDVSGFCVNQEYRKEDTFLGKPLVDFESLEQIFPSSDYKLFIPMTGKACNKVRKRLFNEGVSRGYRFISYISSKATVMTNNIGQNCFILEDNTLQPFTVLGDNIVMWSGNHIGHHSKIGSHSFFTSHVVLSGNCNVQERSWFGVNSTIRDGTYIAEGSLIGMGALITKPTEEDSVYVGSPAKKLTGKSSDEVI